MWRVEPAPTQTPSCASSSRSMSTRSMPGSGNGATAPGAKPVSAATSFGLAIRASACARGARDLLQVAAAVAGDERENGLSVADDDERLDDLAELAPDGEGCVGRARGLERRTPRSAPPPRRRAGTRRLARRLPARPSRGGTLSRVAAARRQRRFGTCLHPGCQPRHEKSPTSLQHDATSSALPHRECRACTPHWTCPRPDQPPSDWT